MDPNRGIVEGPEQNNNDREELDLNALEVEIIPIPNNPPTASNTEEQDRTVNTTRAIPLPPTPRMPIPLPPPQTMVIPLPAPTPVLTEEEDEESDPEVFQPLALSDSGTQFSTRTVNTSPVTTSPEITGPLTTTTASVSSPRSSADQQPGPSRAIQQPEQSELIELESPPSIILGLPPRAPPRLIRRPPRPATPRPIIRRRILLNDSPVVEEARMPSFTVRRPELDEEESSSSTSLPSPSANSGFRRLTIEHVELDSEEELSDEPDFANLANIRPDHNADQAELGPGPDNVDMTPEQVAHQNRMSYLRSVSRNYLPATEWLYEKVEDILDKKTRDP